VKLPVPILSGKDPLFLCLVKSFVVGRSFGGI
jgi:hypothetical protein